MFACLHFWEKQSNQSQYKTVRDSSWIFTSLILSHTGHGLFSCWMSVLFCFVFSFLENLLTTRNVFKFWKDSFKPPPQWWTLIICRRVLSLPIKDGAERDGWESWRVTGTSIEEHWLGVRHICHAVHLNFVLAFFHSPLIHLFWYTLTVCTESF